MKFGIVVFPGSNRESDARHMAEDILGQQARMIWHKDSSLGDVDVVILPGGFSYGDYLRCGAIAKFSILTEAGLLPGVLLRNSSLKFVCKFIHLRVENAETRFTSKYAKGDVLEIPVAHGDGNYFTDADTLKRLDDNNQVVFRYCEPSGELTASSNPNGSISNIAGIINERGNVFGLMPHPEDAVDPVLGHTDGRKLFDSIVENVIHQLQPA
ncbi:MAG: phosphoribosylformylglycinamidine synthase I [Ignavibacteriales bacterium]|nr:phosphoribosylformylglycinamidine synthase I [Ignavibacteriales bacterium]